MNYLLLCDLNNAQQKICSLSRRDRRIIRLAPVFTLETYNQKNNECFQPLLTSLLMCGFTAQLLEHRTGVAEFTGSNPVEALIFFRLLPSNCLNRPFATSDHVVQNPSCWKASSLLFPHWDIKTKRPEPVKLDLPLF